MDPVSSSRCQLAANIAVDLALAEADGVSYLALVQTSLDDAEALHDCIFLPMLDSFAPLPEDDEPLPYRRRGGHVR